MLVGVYFVLGYLLYACAFAVAGSIVSRQEDLQSSSAPLSILLVGGYLAGIATIDAPDGSLATVCTFLPPVAPMVVPGRAAQGALPGWELALSIVLMVACDRAPDLARGADLRARRAPDGRPDEDPRGAPPGPLTQTGTALRRAGRERSARIATARRRRPSSIWAGSRKQKESRMRSSGLSSTVSALPGT